MAVQMDKQIRELTNPDTFWEDVRHIVGFYEGVFHEDWVIKQLQRVADVRYAEITGGEDE